MRNPSVSTKPSLNATSDLLNARQHLAPEQIEGAQHRAGVAGARVGQRDVDHAGADLLATFADLIHHPVRAAAEADRQNATDRLSARLAGYVARDVRLEQRVAQRRPHWERPLAVACIQRGLGRIVGLAEDHVGAVDDVVRSGLPTIMGAALAVVAGGLRHYIERAVGHAEADMVSRGELS